MINIEKHARTAGAYVLYGGYFLFMVGHGKNHGKNELGVVRFGGHREKNETLMQCAAREVKEEASLDVAFYNSEAAYFYREDTDMYRRIRLNEAPSPVLAIRWMGGVLSVMYLAYGMGELKPACPSYIRA